MNKKEKGFTLIELLISIFVFITIITGMINALLNGLKTQKKIISNQKVVSEASYLLEYMSRTLRMAQKDIEGDCLEASSRNYLLLDNGKTIRFINYDGECQEFSLIGEAVHERIADTKSSSDLPSFLPVTSDNVVVKEMLFGDAGSDWGSPANNQSKVVMRMTVSPRDDESEMRLQTVVSQRKINISY